MLLISKIFRLTILLPVIIVCQAMALRGDINGDGQVDLLDIVFISEQWLAEANGAGGDIVGPVFVRDAFNTGKWYAYFPADGTGTYWSRWDFHYPKGTYYEGGAPYEKYFCVQQVMYGIVRPGKVYSPQSNAPAEVNGSWNEGSSGVWSYWYSGGSGEYMKFHVPDGFNQIQLIVFKISGSEGSISISWDNSDVDFLKVTSLSMGDGNGIFEEVLATEADQYAGIRTLRITNNADSEIRIVGLRMWSTELVGNPAVVRQEGFTEGHDLVDVITMPFALTSERNSCDVRNEPSDDVDASVIKLGDYMSAYEFAIMTGPEGGQTKWTGGDAHFGTGQADYTYHEDEYLNGPAIFVNGIENSSVWDDSVNPRNRLLTGNCISIVSEGFVDWNEDEWEDSGEPDIVWRYELTSSGLCVNAIIIWNTNTDTDPGCFSPMFKVPLYNAVGLLRSLPAEKEYDLSVDRTIVAPQSCELRLTNNNVVIRLESIGPMTEVYWKASYNKLYMFNKRASMLGGVSPDSGDIWAIGGRYEIRENRSCSHEAF